MHMLMNDAQRHILSAQAHKVVVSLGLGKQQSRGEAFAGGGRNSVDPDYKNLKYLTTIYTGILKKASLQLELSAKFRPPKLGGYIAEHEIADVMIRLSAGTAGSPSA